MTYYIKYRKTAKGWKADGHTRLFRTATDLKNYYKRTSSVRVKFIKV